jgi:hypothetical protein
MAQRQCGIIWTVFFWLKMFSFIRWLWYKLFKEPKECALQIETYRTATQISVRPEDEYANFNELYDPIIVRHLSRQESQNIVSGKSTAITFDDKYIRLHSKRPRPCPHTDGPMKGSQ